MKLTKLISTILSFCFLLACNGIDDFSTDDIGKVEIPIKVSAPLMDGSITIEYDSIFASDDLDNEFIIYENGMAYFKYDTVFDFYEDLKEFLAMDEVDFSDLSMFGEEFNVDFKTSTFHLPIQIPLLIPNFLGADSVATFDTVIDVNPQDTFDLRYDAFAMLIVPDDDTLYSLTIADFGEDVDLNIDYEVYKIDIRSGNVIIDLSNDGFPALEDDYLTMNPQFHYIAESPIPIDEVYSSSFDIEIFHYINKFPDGVTLDVDLDMLSLYHKETNQVLSRKFTISSLDTQLIVSLEDYYYSSDLGDGKLGIGLIAEVSVDNPKDTLMVPLPNVIKFDASIEGLDFESVLFDYGVDTPTVVEQSFDLDAFDNLPDELEVAGFALLDPLLQIRLQNNLGVPILFEINQFDFVNSEMTQSFEYDSELEILLDQPVDINGQVPLVKDSLLFTNENSTLGDLDLLNVEALDLQIRIITNPFDNASQAASHNFLYNYTEAERENFYDMNMALSIKIPFEFSFESISFRTTSEFPIDMDDIDSLIELQSGDAIHLGVTLLSNDFPFDVSVQFYLDQKGENYDLIHIDSLFDEARSILSQSNDGEWDSLSWSIDVDQDMFDSFKLCDSLTLQIDFDIDENDPFVLTKGGSSQIGYRLRLENSTFIIKEDL